MTGAEGTGVVFEEEPPKRRMTDDEVKAVTQAGIKRGILLNHTSLAIVRARLLEAGATVDQIAAFGPSIRVPTEVPEPETFTPRNRREKRAQAARQRRHA